MGAEERLSPLRSHGWIAAARRCAASGADRAHRVRDDPSHRRGWLVDRRYGQGIFDPVWGIFLASSSPFTRPDAPVCRLRAMAARAAIWRAIPGGAELLD